MRFAPEEPTETSWHCVTERWRCYAIEKKYGWKLLSVERTSNTTLKYKCIFEGETQFPDYRSDED
ncbi:hypothetical protein [Microseira sp. BLCC-F43]|uniref:hypothetical protein n=1 Tax=Microseira sp. BLCC-F43 TaxID=3153602 RepID=UPI0035B7CE90